jgi:hypothetical protein
MGGATVGLVVAMVVVVVVSVTRGNQNQNKKPCSTIKKNRQDITTFVIQKVFMQLVVCTIILFVLCF